MKPSLWVCWVLVGWSVGASANLVSNGNFAAGLNGWEPDQALRAAGQVEVVADAGRPAVVRLENRGANATVGLSQTIPADPGKLYQVRCWLRSTALAETGGVAVWALDAQGQVLQRRWPIAVPAWGVSGWQEQYGEYRPPAGAVQLQVRIGLFKPGTIWLTDLQVTAVDPPERIDPWGQRLTDFGLEAQAVAVPRPLLHLAVADLEADRRLDLVGVDTGGKLVRVGTDGVVAWEVDLGGLAHAVTCGDLDGDGIQEIVVGTADREGRLRTFRADGTPGWSVSVDGPLFAHLACADLTGDGAAEVLGTYRNMLVCFSGRGHKLWERTFRGPRMRGVASGDLTGDGRIEVGVANEANRLHASAFAADGTPLWQFNPVEHRRLNGDDLQIADLDGDGRNELVIGGSDALVYCVDGAGQLRWMVKRQPWEVRQWHPDSSAAPLPLAAQVAVHDFAPERPGLETLVGLLDRAWLIDAAGKLIWESQSGKLLSDLVLGPDGSLWCPGSGLRDAAVYRLEVRRDGANPLPDQIAANPIHADLDQLYQQVGQLPSEMTDGPVEPCRVIYANLPAIGQPDWQAKLRAVDAFLRTKENDRLQFVFMLWPKDLPVELHRGPVIEPALILEAVELLRELRRPFLFFACHGSAPNLSLPLVEATLRAAPEQCLGFYVAENMEQYPGGRFDDFLTWATAVLDLCRRYGGKQLVLKEMYDAWSHVVADPVLAESIFRPEHRDQLVVIYATNNPHGPELQTGGMIGLHHAGLVSAWGISTQYWNWSWSEHTVSEQRGPVCGADVILQMELAAACLGARWFHIEGGQEYLVRDQWTLDPRAQRHRDLVYELIRRGVLSPPAPAGNASFNDLVVVRGPLPGVAEARAAGANWGSPVNRPAALRQGLLGLNEALQTSHDGYLPRVAYGVEQYTSTMAPPTPFGYLRIVPDLPRCAEWLADRPSIVTDGVGLTVAGQPVPPGDQGPILRRLLAAGASAVPAASSELAVFAHRRADGYRLWLLNPGYLTPTAVTGRVTLRPPLPTAAVDLFSGSELPLDGDGLTVTIPAGLFRVIDLRGPG